MKNRSLIFLFLVGSFAFLSAVEPSDDGVYRPDWSNRSAISLENLDEWVDGIDPLLPDYEPREVSPKAIKSVGSDLLNNVQALIGMTYQEYYSDTPIEIEGKGGSIATAALVAGTTDIGQMSRGLYEREIQAFTKARPTRKLIQFPVGFYVFQVLANNENPINDITHEELFQAYGKKGSDSSNDHIRGVDSDADFTPYLRNESTFLYGYVRKEIMKRHPLGEHVVIEKNDTFIARSIASDQNGLGIVGLAIYPNCKTLSVEGDSGEAVHPSLENVFKGHYPLMRTLYLVVSTNDKGHIDRRVVEFLRLLYSREGQMAVVKDGFTPLPESLVKPARDLVSHFASE